MTAGLRLGETQQKQRAPAFNAGKRTPEPVRRHSAEQLNGGLSASRTKGLQVTIASQART